jgi:predicted glycoside hydrolase/deacetylase ChbG (UPF0249 family)
MKRIIIQGDDLGYKPEVNRGIKYAYENGILTQTTVMVNTLNPKEKDKYSRQIKGLKNKTQLKKPKLGIGVHLNLTYGKPLSPNWPQKELSRPFKGSGKPGEWQGSTWREYFKQFSTKQVEDEYKRQIELVLDIFGKISHLDSHQMTASYEPMIGIYETLAKEYDLPVRPIAPLSENPIYGGNFVIDKKINREMKSRGTRMVDKNIFTLFFNEDDPIKSFLNQIEKVEDGMTAEIMFHPAIGKKADIWRLIDLKTLTSKESVSYFNKNNIELISYNHV